MKFGLNMPAHIDSWKDMTVAEDLGFTSAWFYDSQMLYSDIYATMTLVAEHTKHIKIGTGIVVPNGSDAPVEHINPLLSFHSAVSRQDAENWPAGGWMSEQRMTREEALQSMTIWPAFAAFQEGTMGSLSPGKLADFVVLDRDIMTVAERDILGTAVLATYIGGKAVYERAP